MIRTYTYCRSAGRGVTLIELMIVVTILIVLVAASVPAEIIDPIKSPNPFDPFKVDAPHSGPGPVAHAVNQVLEDTINPAVKSHGGVVSLVAVEDSTAYLWHRVSLQGFARSRHDRPS